MRTIIAEVNLPRRQAADPGGRVVLEAGIRAHADGKAVREVVRVHELVTSRFGQFAPSRVSALLCVCVSVYVPVSASVCASILTTPDRS